MTKKKLSLVHSTNILEALYFYEDIIFSNNACVMALLVENWPNSMLGFKLGCLSWV